jgi:hypothetical protein
VPKSPANTLIANDFSEFPQPNIEWHLKRTFAEHGSPPAEGDGCAYCAHFVPSPGIAFMHEFRVNFSDARFLEFRLRETDPGTRHAGIGPLRTTPAARPGAMAEGRAPWGLRARRRPDGGDDLLLEKAKVNTLIANKFPEFLQPNIERPSQRTFGEHGHRPAEADGCTYCAHFVRAQGMLAETPSPPRRRTDRDDYERNTRLQLCRQYDYERKLCLQLCREVCR